MKAIKTTALAGMAMLLMAIGGASAVEFPTRPVTLIVPFPPGGASDQIARPLGAALERLWKQPVVIQNRGGAGGVIGLAATANARPDGYTFAVGHPIVSSATTADEILGLPPRLRRDQLEPLARISADPLILVVKADAPWKTIEDLVAEARAKPGEIAYASSGTYSALHLPSEMLAHAAGIRLNHVPYTGGGPAITAVLGGHVAFTTGVPSVVAPQIRSGELRGLLNTGAQRVALLPDVPTAKERGFDNVEFYLWIGMFAPPKLPDDILGTLRQSIGEAVQDPTFVGQMASMGTPIAYQDAPEFRAFLEADFQRADTAIRRIGKVD